MRQWTVQLTYAAYGLHFGLRSNDPAALEQVSLHLPYGWQLAAASQPDILYSLYFAPTEKGKEANRNHLLFCGQRLLAQCQDFSQLLTTFEKHAELSTALHARERLFVHAGVVGWQGQAIVIPGRSMSGKTTLVKALVEAGAVYYSDEFAVLDKHGRVHPYPIPLSIRREGEQMGHKTPVASLGGQTGVESLPVGLIAVTRYRPQAVWRSRRLSPGEALLALMDNTVAARRAPDYSMPILKQAVINALALKSERGEAEDLARHLLAELKPTQKVAPT